MQPAVQACSVAASAFLPQRGVMPPFRGRVVIAESAYFKGSIPKPLTVMRFWFAFQRVLKEDGKAQEIVRTTASEPNRMTFVSGVPKVATALPRFQRIPAHIGIIPDGNRRWAAAHGMPKCAGYAAGIEPGLQLYELCLALGIKELTLYGYTQDNTKRPTDQKKAFQRACIQAVQRLTERDVAMLVIGDSHSPLFPRELMPYTRRTVFGKGSIRVNFLVNYGWRWDISHALHNGSGPGRSGLEKRLASADISRIDLIIRWGGRRRLSGFLPLQSVYADFYFLDALWPDFEPRDLFDALRWYEGQDVTLGG